MINLQNNAKILARKRDESNSLYENYARKNGLQGKSLLILMWIYYTKGGITQNIISEKTYSTKQVVNATIKSFEKKGYIYYEDSSRDKRKKLVKLTKEGYIFVSKILDPLEEAEINSISKLSNEQQQVFIECFKVFNNNMKENIGKLL